jgi:hypothetical protein
MKRFLPLVAGIASVICVLLMYQNTGTVWHNQYDDSYITYRYAVNLAEHNELVFNLGERTDAASSFLYTLVLAGFFAVGIHDMEAVSGALNMFSIAEIAFFLCMAAGNTIAGLALGVIISMHGFISGWAVLGMDTVPFAAMLTAWAYVTFYRRNETASMVLVILIMLMRFEGAMLIPIWYFATGRNVKRALIVLGCLAGYWTWKYCYYGTIIPHSLWAKEIMVYYQANPQNIIAIWKKFAIVAPLIALVGIAMDRTKLWLGVYIVLSGTSCLFGPHSDWGRYTVHLLPLIVLAGIPLTRRWWTAIPVIVMLVIPGFTALQWMHYNAAKLAPAQEMRGTIGSWLEKNAPGEWVISGDLGMIGYKAIDCKFIDMFGLVSSDVLFQYKQGVDPSSVIIDKKPRYIADTFNIRERELLYTHNTGESIRGTPKFLPWNESNFKMLLCGKYSEDIAIGVARINAE